MRSVVLSFGRSVSRITHGRDNGCRPNMVSTARARGDPLEVINFLCLGLSGRGYVVWITFHFFAARCYASAAYAVMPCPSVRHVRGFCQNDYTYV